MSVFPQLSLYQQLPGAFRHSAITPNTLSRPPDPFRHSYTYRATSESCCLVRFRGWLKAVIPYWRGFAPFCRLARRMALLMTFRKELTACHPLLLNHTWNKTSNVSKSCSSGGRAHTQKMPINSRNSNHTPSQHVMVREHGKVITATRMNWAACLGLFNLFNLHHSFGREPWVLSPF